MTTTVSTRGIFWAALIFNCWIAAQKVSGDPYFNGSEAERELAKAIARLPEKQRQVFLLRWWDELSYEEISAITGTSVGALKASFHIAKEKLQLNLSDTEVSK